VPRTSRFLFFDQTISRRLYVLVLTLALGMLGVLTIATAEVRTALWAAKGAETRHLVEIAHSLVTDYQRRASLGEITEQAAQHEALARLAQLRYGPGTYFWVNDTAGRILMHPTVPAGSSVIDLRDAAGARPFRDMIELVSRQGSGLYQYFWPADATARLKQSYVQGVADWNWIIGSGVYVDDVEATIRRVVLRIGLAGGVALVVALVLAAALARGITKPIIALAGVMGKLAGGELTADVPGQERRDEIGAMAAAAVVLRDSIREANGLAQDAHQRQAQEQTQAALVAMADAIEAEAGQALEQVHARTTAMAETATEMSGSAARTGRSAESATLAAANAMSTSQTVASAADQLATAISEIGNQVGQSAAAASLAVTTGHETRAAIEALNDQVSRIGAVADMIGDIAGRTNLLALNATIEAARAGAAGKGFAVVAGEVKSLATQTARSTQEIARRISEVRNATRQAVAAVARIEETISAIDAVSSGVASAVEKQAAATMGIGFNVTETEAAARDMGERITEVSAEAEQTERHAVAVRENAAALELAVAELRHAVIHVVRTSTTEVNRRRATRHPVDLPCRLNMAGGTYEARVTDLSESGAQLCDVPQLEAGGGGTISLDGLAIPLSFAVRSTDHRGALHVEFEENEAARSAVGALLDKLQRRRVA
jgi:methyl-accepting chemotaxis protein